MTHPRRIAFFMPDLSGGGVERMRLQLAPALAEAGDEVVLIVQRRAGPLHGQVPPNIRLVELGAHRSLAAILPLARWLRRHPTDVLISSLGHTNIVAAVARLLACVPTRVVLCQHNALSAERALGAKYRILPLLYRLCAPLADAFVAVSEGVADDMAAATGIPRHRIEVIYNPVLPPHALLPTADPPPHPWLADQAVPCFIFAGRLVAQKDPVLLLEAFARRRAHGPARLVLLGQGPMAHALQRRAIDLGIAGSVSFPGFVPNLLAWISHAAALVVTSRYEGFCNVIVEALACGTPVISTDCPHGPSEILQHGQYGQLVPVGSVDALAAALATNPRDHYPANMLRARAADFTVAACVARHHTLVDRLGTGPTSRAFGLQFCAAPAWHVADQILTQPATAGPLLVVTPNIDHIRLLRRPAFAAAYQQAHLICADGFPVALYAALRRAAPPRRVTGCTIIRHLMAHAPRTQRRVLVVVESAATRAALLAWITRRGLTDRWQVALAPPLLANDPAGQHRLATRVADIAPDILVMTLGAPVSEEFVNAHRHTLPPCWALCVGQAVRVELGLTQRAPAWLQRTGLEWAWRLGHEPRRLGLRYVKAGLWFPLAVVADLLPHL